MPPVTDEELSAYVDGALDPARHVEVAREIERDAAIKEKVEAYQRQNLGLTALYGSVLDEPIPEHISGMVARRSAAPRSFTLRHAAMAASLGALLLGAGFAAGWYSRVEVGKQDALFATVVRQAVLAHQSLELGDGESQEGIASDGEPRAFEITAAANPFDVALRAPESTGTTGFRPVSMGNSVDASGPSAQILYQDDSGNRFSLFVREHSKSRKVPFEATSIDDYDAIYWIDGPLVYVLVGQGGEEPLVEIAQTFYAAAGIRPGPGSSQKAPDAQPAAIESQN